MKSAYMLVPLLAISRAGVFESISSMMLLRLGRTGLMKAYPRTSPTQRLSIDTVSYGLRQFTSRILSKEGRLL